ncbi:MAG: hypothetical protein HY791_24140 [Deltaproteobacteria bacterium]|nr:hypothetical protein [Deltaproteobacteria bacterium]
MPDVARNYTRRAWTPTNGRHEFGDDDGNGNGDGNSNGEGNSNGDGNGFSP